MPRPAHPALTGPRIVRNLLFGLRLYPMRTFRGPLQRPRAEPIDARAGSVRHTKLFDIEQVVTAPGGVPNLR